jgi:hypothetical protein
MGQYPNTRFFLIKIAAKVGQVKALMLLVFFRGTVIDLDDHTSDLPPSPKVQPGDVAQRRFNLIFFKKVKLT